MGNREPAQYQFWSRHSFAKDNLIDIWTSFKCNRMWGDVSTWELTLPTDEFISKWSCIPPQPTSFIMKWGGIRVIRNGVMLIAGPVISAHRTKVGNDDMITLSGTSDTYYLSTRLIWPYYAYCYKPFGDPDGYERRWTDISAVLPIYCSYGTGWAGNLMKDYVNQNIGPIAFNVNDATHMEGHPYDRRMSWTYGGAPCYIDIEGDFNDGTSTTYEGRFQTVLDCCKTLSRAQEDPGSVADEVDFWLDNTVDGALTFRTVTPVDKSGETVFGTKLGNIRSLDYTENRPEVNAMMVGGPEKLAGGVYTGASSRLFAYTGTTSSVASMATYGMIEGFYDWSGADNDASLWQISTDMKVAGRAEVDTKAYDITVKMTLEEGQMYTLMDDYDIGYIVDVQIDDMVYTDIIREIEITVDAGGGEILSPTVCSPRRWRPSPPSTYAAYDARRKAIDTGRFK